LRDINIFVARWHEQAWRLAIVLHLGQHGKEAHLVPIARKTAENAVTLAKWFGQEQTRIISVMRTLKDQDRIERLIMILNKMYKGVVSLRTLRRHNNWDPEEVRRLAKVPGSSITIEFIESNDTQKRGRRIEIVRIRP
jgi:hypothetical protein